MRKKVIAANWKMYKTSAEAKEFCLKLRPLLTAQESVQSIIFAPFTALAALKEGLADTDIAIGAQNFYPQNEGAYTGEISLNMLKEFGVTYVLIGHSERRGIFGESNELKKKKLLKALAEDFKPILCIGEPWEIREKGEALEYCLKQLESAFAGLNTAEIKKIVIAYELSAAAKALLSKMRRKCFKAYAGICRIILALRRQRKCLCFTAAVLRLRI